MYSRNELEVMGYTIGTKLQDFGWVAILEIENQARTFRGVSEDDVIERAGQYVYQLEERYREQQALLACAGCGECAFTG